MLSSPLKTVNFSLPILPDHLQSPIIALEKLRLLISHLFKDCNMAELKHRIFNKIKHFEMNVSELKEMGINPMVIKSDNATLKVLLKYFFKILILGLVRENLRTKFIWDQPGRSVEGRLKSLAMRKKQYLKIQKFLDEYFKNS